ncbi:MAG: ABC transporter ATP-binding protein [Aquiluna sp.]|jgi:iron complex transport system ATP-binding protein|tara:strand:- start:909 stop:1703 length:795 start_codon:yes stop_codon:yes gene_type:complete
MYQPESKLAAQALSAGYSADQVIQNLDMEICQGSVTAIIGPNGAGKTSLLKALARKIPAASGAVLLDGISITSLTKAEINQSIGFLAAIPVARNQESVFDLVARSATAARQISRVSPRLKEEIETLLERTSLNGVRDKKVGELSSGYRQCAVIAAALVKNPAVLLLDEPTNSLDYSHQLQVMNLLSSLKRERGTTVVAVIHDLNLAARFADHIVILKDGSIVAQGTPHEVITPNNLADAFRILARVIDDPVGKTPLVIPIRQLA